MRHAAGRDEQGRTIALADPLAGRLRTIAAGAGSDPAALAAGFLALREVFGDDLPREQRFTAAVTAWLDSLLAKGARATVAECIAG
jgi:fructuronate reductase